MFKTPFIVLMIFSLPYVAVGNEGRPVKNIEMTNDHLGNNCKETIEGDGLTTCYVKGGTTQPFYGSLTVKVLQVSNLTVNLKWKILGETAIRGEKMCLDNGQTVIGNENCKDKDERIPVSSHHSSSKYYYVRVPNNGKVKNDTLTLTGNVKWYDNTTSTDFLINTMKVLFE